jgi:transmembrane sensor
MTEPVSPSPLDEEASYWFLRLRDEDVEANEIEAALNWCDQSPEHRAAFARVESFWRLSDKIVQPPMADLPSPGTAISPLRRQVDPRWRYAALAATVVLAVTASWGMLSTHRNPPQPVRYATAVGENRTIGLTDGSEIVLGGASEISVSYSRSFRKVNLLGGEAFFHVAKDPARAFVVSSAGGQTQAVGTQFDVRRGLDGATVTVLEGVVQVRSDAPASSGGPVVAANLTAGRQLSYSANGAISPIASVLSDQVTAWQSGKLIFVDRPLADIVLDLNRYSRWPVTIDDENVKTLRITGVVMVNNIGEWLRALEKNLPIKLVATEEKLTLVSAAESPNKK